MTAAWKQLSAHCELDKVDCLIDMAQAHGAQAVMQENAGEDSYYDLAAPSLPQWQKQRVTALFEHDQSIDGLLLTIKSSLPEVSAVSISNLEDQNWETVWQNQYVAQEIESDLWVCPSWSEEQFPQSAIVIKIDPGLAFGTGTHETTQLCMRLLKRLDYTNNLSILDYGCGSGILAIAAIKLGAQQAVGVDIDPKAEQVAIENSQTNGVSDQFKVRSASQVEGERYNVVVANILAGALVDLHDAIANAVDTGGTLILSGILAHQAQSVISAYDNEFDFETIQKNEWVALLGTKDQPC